MKRIAFIFILLMSIGTLSMAQIKFGVRGGVSSSSIKVDQEIGSSAEDYWYDLQSGNAMVGYHVGVMMRVSFFKLYVQPELLFSSTGGEVKVTDLKTSVQSTEFQMYKKIDIPVMAGYRAGPVRLQAGPVASFTLNSEPVLKDLLAGVEEDFKTATFGYQAGIGVDLLKFLAIDLKYEGNLSKIGDGISIGNFDAGFDTRNPQIILSLGFMF